MTSYAAVVRSVPLRVRLVAAMTALVAIGLAVAGVVAVASLRGYLLQRVDDQLRRVSAPLGDGGPRTPPGDPDHGAGLDRGRPSAFYVAALGADGHVIGVRDEPFDTAQPLPQVPRLTAA